MRYNFLPFSLGNFNDGYDDLDDGPWANGRFGNDNFGGGGGGGGGGNFGGGMGPMGGFGNGNFGGSGGGLFDGGFNNMGGGGGGGGGGGSGGNFNNMRPGNAHCIHMRGLPFRATKQDVADVSYNFFL